MLCVFTYVSAQQDARQSLPGCFVAQPLRRLPCLGQIASAPGFVEGRTAMWPGDKGCMLLWGCTYTIAYLCEMGRELNARNNPQHVSVCLRVPQRTTDMPATCVWVMVVGRVCAVEVTDRCV